jgi:hypothetical protein
MVAQTHVVGSVDTLAHYLSYGKAENNNKVENRDERVAWESDRNLRGAGSIKVAKRRFKQAAARKGRMVKKPNYEIILSWQSGNEKEGIPPDDPSREEMEQSVDRVLSELNLEEHQAWIVAHRDTDTPHVHVVVNRVHPRTGETWSPSYDQTTLYHTLREIEEEKGWHRPGPMKIEDLSSDRQKNLEYWEKESEKLGRERSVRQWAREEGIPGLLKGAESWEQVEKILHGTGATLKPRRERGMVIERDGGHAALSSIDPTISRPKLEDRYGQSWEAYREGRESAEERLSELLGHFTDPSEGQLRVYRLVERIEALRRADQSDGGRDHAKGDHEKTSRLSSQKKEARVQIVSALRDVRDGQRGSGEIVDLMNRLRREAEEKEAILSEAMDPARSKRQGAMWAAETELSRSQKRLLRKAREGHDASPEAKARLRIGLTHMADRKAEELTEYLDVRERVAFDRYGKQEARSAREILEEEWSKVENCPADMKLSGAQKRALRAIYSLKSQGFMPSQTDSESQTASESALADAESQAGGKARTDGEGQTGGGDQAAGPTDDLRRALVEMETGIDEGEIGQLKAHLEGEERLQEILESQREPAERVAVHRQLAEEAESVAERATRRVREQLNAGTRKPETHKRGAKIFLNERARILEIKSQAPDGDKIEGLGSRLDRTLSEDTLADLHMGIEIVKIEEARVERGSQEAFEALTSRQQKAANICEIAGRREEESRRRHGIKQAADLLAEMDARQREEVGQVIGGGEVFEKASAIASQREDRRGREREESRGGKSRGGGGRGR